MSGQLRLAPEHVSDAVLSVMGKPRREVYDAFVERFERLSAEYGLKQYVVPYLISSHPGSTMKEAVELAEAVRDMGYMPEQVQDFYPTPSTMSTCMFYTGVDPRTMEPVYIPRDPHEKAMQRALIQYRKPENYKLVKEALRKAGREDLIGYGAKCLIRPVPPKSGTGGKKTGAVPSKAGATGKRAKGSGTERPQRGSGRGPGNENPAAPQPQNRAERRAAARSGKKGSAPTTGRGGAKQHGRPSPGTPGGRAIGESAAGTNPHARNRAAQGRQGANRH